MSKTDTPFLSDEKLIGAAILYSSDAGEEGLTPLNGKEKVLAALLWMKDVYEPELARLRSENERLTQDLGLMTIDRDHWKRLEASCYLSLQTRDGRIAALENVAQVCVDRLVEVVWDVDNCDWHCGRCELEYGMTDTDLYNSAKAGLSTAKEAGITPTEP